MIKFKRIVKEKEKKKNRTQISLNRKIRNVTVRIISKKILKKEVMLKLAAKHLITATIMIKKAMVFLTKKIQYNTMSNKRFYMPTLRFQNLLLNYKMKRLKSN